MYEVIKLGEHEKTYKYTEEYFKSVGIEIVDSEKFLPSME